MNNRFDWRDFLTFDKMIAPTFLTILYYIHLVVLGLACLLFIFKGLDTPYAGGMMVFGGLIGLVIGPFLVRLGYEFVIVIFKIHSRLVSIDGKSKTDGLEINASVFVSKPAEVIQPELQVAPVSIPPPSIAPPTPTQDFWSAETGEPVFSTPVNAVSSDDVKGLLQKVPNLPVVIASLFVLIGIVSSYANVMGLSYSIKNSTFGVFALFAAIGMVGISATGFKWLWFVSCYAVTLLSTVLAFFDDNSLFSQASRGREAIGSIGSMADQYLPGTNRFIQQATQNTPGPSQFLTVTFYLFVIAMIYCGYWALSGKYRERGLINS